MNNFIPYLCISQLKTNTMNKETKVISEVEMIEIFKSVESSTFVNILSKTKVRMNKTNNPYFDKVTKVSKCNYLIGNEYETRVQTNESKEGHEKTFESEENKNGKHVSKCVLFNEKLNKYYLQYEFFKENKPTTEYIFENDNIGKELFESYLVKKSDSSRQQQERKVLFQSFSMSSINEFTLGGTHYVVER